MALILMMLTTLIVMIPTSQYQIWPACVPG